MEQQKYDDGVGMNDALGGKEDFSAPFAERCQTARHRSPIHRFLIRFCSTRTRRRRETSSLMHPSLCLAKACASLQAHATKDVEAPGALHFHKGSAFKNTATFDGFIVGV